MCYNYKGANVLIDKQVQAELDKLVARFNKVKATFSGKTVAYHSVLGILSKAVYDSLCIKLGKPPTSVAQEPTEPPPSNFIPADGDREPIPVPITYEEEFEFNDEHLIDKFYADNKSVELSVYLACIRRIEAQVVYIIPWRYRMNEDSIAIKKGTYTVLIIEPGMQGIRYRIYNVWDDHIKHTTVEYGAGLVVDPGGPGYRSKHWPSGGSECRSSFTVPAGEPYSNHPDWDDPANLGSNRFDATGFICGGNALNYVYPPPWTCFTAEEPVDRVVTATSFQSPYYIMRSKPLTEVPYLTVPTVEFEPELDSEWYIRYTGQVRVKAVNSWDAPTLGFEDCYQANQICSNQKKYSGFNGKAGKNVLIKLEDSYETKLEKIAEAQGTGYGSQGGNYLFEVHEVRALDGVNDADYLPLDDMPYRSGVSFENGSEGATILISWSCNGISLN